MSDRIESIIDALRKKLLDAAVRGELVDQNNGEEPASALLERIAAERSRLIREKKIKKPKSSSRIERRDGHFYESVDGSTPVCIDDELPFEIPDSWEWVRLGEIATLISGQDLTPKDYHSERSGIPYITGASNFDKGKLVINRWTTTPKSVAVRGSILLTCKGTIGELAILCENKAHIARQVMAICPIIKGSVAFLMHVLQAAIKEYKYQAQSMIPGISRSVVLKTHVPLPPLQEQHRIVDALERHLKQLDILRESHRRMRRILHETPTSLRQQLLQAAIEGKLVAQDPKEEPASALLERIAKERAALPGKRKAAPPSRIERRSGGIFEIFPDGSEKDISDEIPFDIPESWEWVRMSFIGDWKAGATPSKSDSSFYRNGNIPWLKTGDLNDGYINCIPERITEKAMRTCSLRLNPAGSILIAMYGATIGKLGILSFPATTNQACCACITNSSVSNMYLFYYLMSQKQSFTRKGEGGAQPNISKEKIEKHLIPIPPINEQQRIVQRLEELLPLVSQA